MTTIASTYDLVRALLGDFHTRKLYPDAGILGVVRVIVKTGQLPGYELSPDQNSITPDLATPQDWGILLYRAAIRLLVPRAHAYSYSRRELSERFGDRALALVDLQEQLFDLENPECFATTQTLAAYLNGMTGVNIYAEGTELRVAAPFETNTVSRSGITTSTG